MWAISAAALLAFGARPSAQAWVGPAGSGSVTAVVQAIDNTTHFTAAGEKLPPVASGASRDRSLYFEAEYAVTDRLSLSAGVPFVFARYDGPGSLGPLQAADRCGCWNVGLQDVGLRARFNLVNGASGVTPSVALGLPTHDYPYRGEAVLGRRLKELRLGVDAGQRLDRLSPRLAVEMHYAYAFVERVLGVPANRSNTAAEGSYAISRVMTVRGLLSWQRVHGGLRTGRGRPPDEGFPFGDITSAALFAEHDRLLRDNYFHAGLGAAWSVRRLGVDVFGSYVGFLRGTDAHAGRALTVGVSRGFGG